MRVSLVALPLALAAIGCSSSEFRVSDGAREKAQALLRTIETDVAASCSAGPEGRNFDASIKKARGELAELRGVAKSKGDRAVMLLVASVLMRDRERCTLIGMGAETGHESVAQLEGERGACMVELKPWLEGQGREDLLRASCLAMAEQAAQTLLLK